MPILVNKAGEQMEVEHAQVLEMLKTGQWGVPKGAVNMVGAQGPAQVDSSQLMQALEQGLRIESPEETRNRMAAEALDTNEGAVAAGTAGFLRGITMGLSDVVLTASQTVTPERLQALKEVHPGKSVATEVGGAVTGAILARRGAPTRFTPAGMATRAGIETTVTTEAAILKAITGKGKDAGLLRTALAKSGGWAAGGAVEGGLYGVGHAISEDSLGNADSVGEALAAHVGPSIILGAGVGGVFGGVGGLAGGTLGKLSKRASTSLDNVGKKMMPAMDDAAVTQSLESIGVTKAAQKKLSRSQRATLRRLFLEDASHADGFPILHRELPDLSQETILGRTADVFKQASDDMDTAIVRLDELATQRGLAFKIDGKSIAARIKADVVPNISQYGKPGRKLAGRLKGDAARFSQKPDIDMRDVYKIREQFAHAAGADDFRNIAMKRVDDIVRDEQAKALIKARSQLDPAHVDAYLKAQKVYEGLRNVINAAGPQSKSKLGGLLRKVLMSAGHGITSGMFFGSPGKRMAIHALGASVRSGLTSNFGPGARALAAHKAARLAEVNSLMAKLGKRLNSAINGISRGWRLGRRTGVPASATILQKVTGEKNREKAYMKLHGQISDVVADPQHAANRMAVVTGGLEEAAPNVSGAFASTVAFGVKMMADNLIEGRPHPSIQPHLDVQRPPSKAKIARFARAAQGVLDPVSVFEDLANGIPNKEGAQAVATVYPQLFETGAAMVAEMVAKHKDKLSYSDIVRLSVFFDRPMSGDTEAMYIARAQQAFAKIDEFEGQPPSARQPKKSKKGVDSTSLASASQRMEEPV